MTMSLERPPVGGAPHDDSARLAALYRLDVLDKPRRRDLDSLARLAAHVCNVPTAAVNLIDADRQWPAAAFGLEPLEVRRSDSMCTTSIQSHDITHTVDASQDPRWSDNPHTTGELASIKFYAAAPLVMAGGEIVGTICAFDSAVQEVTRTQIERMRDLADVAAQLLELHQETERLGQAAMRDALTGLPNRALFAESLERSIALAARGASRPTVFFLDIDGFKTVNDTYGHAAGDEVLREFAERLVAAVRSSDLVARLGGDEFVLLCDGPTDDPPDIAGMTARLREELTPPIQLTCVAHRPMVQVGVSVGAATAGPDGTCADLVLRADAAMYLDKATRRTPPAAALHRS